jgi:hypothetical protein
LSVNDGVYDRSLRSCGRHSWFHAYADDDNVTVRLVRRGEAVGLRFPAGSFQQRPRRRAQFSGPFSAAEFYGVGSRLAALCRTLYRVFRRRTVQFRKQFSRGQDENRLRDVVEQRSSASRPDARQPRNLRSTALRRGGFIVSAEAGKSWQFSSDIVGDSSAYAVLFEGKTRNMNPSSSKLRLRTIGSRAGEPVSP